MPEQNIQTLLEFWGNTFGLQEWRIVVYIVEPAHSALRSVDEPGEEIVGSTLYDLDSRTAVIYLADPLLVEHPLNLEWTLAHELGHLLLDPIQIEMGDSGQELLINRIVQACFRASGRPVDRQWKVGDAYKN